MGQEREAASLLTWRRGSETHRIFHRLGANSPPTAGRRIHRSWRFVLARVSYLQMRQVPTLAAVKIASFVKSELHVDRVVVENRVQ